MPTIILPADVSYIIKRLASAGFEAYAVGGCVRDSLMGKTPKDWDVATSAAPEQMIKAFQGSGAKIIPTGVKHGTLTIVLNRRRYEATTFRIDGDYGDGRRPDSIAFTGRLKDDLARRDFTINAMAYNDEEGLADCFGGRADLDARLIRCVGDPRERFSEDYLRMLRAYRFSCSLDFDIDGAALSAIRENMEKITKISAERIRDEFEKIIMSDNFDRITAFFEDFSKVLFPGLEALRGLEQTTKYHCLDVFDHTMAALRDAPADRILRLAAIFHDIGKAERKTTGRDGKSHFYGHAAVSAKMARNILTGLRYDNKTTDLVCAVIGRHSEVQDMDSPKHVRKLINRAGREAAGYILRFAIHDLAGKSAYAREAFMENNLRLLEWFDEISAAKEPCGIKDLDISGHDVMALSPDLRGPKVGEAMAFLMERVLEDPSLNKKETLAGLVVNNFAGPAQNRDEG